jgi:hypothetical protein
MSYAFINPSQAMLEMTLEALGGFAPTTRSDTAEVPTIAWELGESWKAFEKDLGKFKRELARVRRDMQIKSAELNELYKSIQMAKLIADNIPSEGLKTQLSYVIDSYESEEGADALTQQCGELKGQFEAMKKVLENTNAERYEKFTCFICQDRLIDLFIDPCGHVVCEHCWVQTRDKTKCPGCRTVIHGSKKIFTI